MYRNPFEAYQAVERKTLSGRELEASVLTKAAQMLKDCQRNWTAADREERLASALKNNQRIWTVLQVELSRDDNPLPTPIKRNLLLLSGFVDKRCFEVLAYPTPEKLDILIDINTNIASGLRQTPSVRETGPVAGAGPYQTTVSPPMRMPG